MQFLTSKSDWLTPNTDISAVVAVVGTDRISSRALDEPAISVAAVDIVQPDWSLPGSEWVICSQALVECDGSYVYIKEEINNKVIKQT